MVYSRPETLSDEYVNQGCRNGRRTREERRVGVRVGEQGRSLQKCQAMVHFSRQLKWGQREERRKAKRRKKNLFSDSLPLQVEKYHEFIFSLFTFNFYKLNNKRAAHLECESVSLSKSPCFFLGTKCLHSIWHHLPSLPSQCHFKKQKNCLHILASKKPPFCISLATAEKQWRSFCMYLSQVVVDILR